MTRRTLKYEILLNSVWCDVRLRTGFATIWLAVVLIVLGERGKVTVHTA
jgi:hypothetical protein